MKKNLLAIPFVAFGLLLSSCGGTSELPTSNDDNTDKTTETTNEGTTTVEETTKQQSTVSSVGLLKEGVTPFILLKGSVKENKNLEDFKLKINEDEFSIVIEKDLSFKSKIELTDVLPGQLSIYENKDISYFLKSDIIDESNNTITFESEPYNIKYTLLGENENVTFKKEESFYSTRDLKVNNVDIFEDEGKAYFSFDGFYNSSKVTMAEPVFRIGEGEKLNIRGNLTFDAETGEISGLIDITALYLDSWNDIKIFPNGEDLNNGLEICIDDFSEEQYKKKLEFNNPNFENVKQTFELHEWGKNLKISAIVFDGMETKFDDMEITLEETNVYLNVKGTNTHNELKVFIKNGDNVKEGVVTTSDDNTFVAKIRIDDFVTGKNDIRYEYLNAIGVKYNGELTNVDGVFTNDQNLEGLSYGGHNYVFQIDTWDVNRYYKISRNDDKFTMNTLQLKVAEDKVLLTIKGNILDVTNKDNFNVKIKGVETPFAILAENVDANGVLNCEIDVTDVPLFDSLGEADPKGAIVICDGEAELNGCWPNDWSHRNEITEVTLNEKTYKLEGVGWGQLGLKVANV